MKVGLTVSQVSIWSDLVGSRLLARDTGLLQSRAAPSCCETLAHGEFPRAFFLPFISTCLACPHKHSQRFPSSCSWQGRTSSLSTDKHFAAFNLGEVEFTKSQGLSWKEAGTFAYFTQDFRLNPVYCT